MPTAKAQLNKRRYNRRSLQTREELVELATRLDSLDEDYSNLTNSVAGLSRRQDEMGLDLRRRIDEMGTSINNKLDQRFQPQWQTWIAAAALAGAFFLAFWSAGITPLEKTQTNFAQDLATQQNATRVENLATREVVRLHAIDDRQRFDALVRDFNETLTKRNDIFLTRREHDEFAKRGDREYSQLRLDLTEIRVKLRSLRGNITDLYPAKNVVEELGRHISDIERRLKGP